MKKFNKSKVIIPALAMIALTTAASATGTVAWFAANSTVTAEHLSVSIKSESTFLLIDNQATGADDAAKANSIQTRDRTSKVVVTESGNSVLMPVAHETTGFTYQTVEALNSDDNTLSKHWYTMVSDNPADTVGTAQTHTPIKVANFANYVKKFTYYLTVAKGSEPATNLTISNFTIAMNNTANGTNETIDPVKVLVVGDNAMAELDNANKTSNTVLFTGQLTDSTITTVSVYVYFDGNNAAVTSNNKANLEGATIDLSFVCDRYTAPVQP